MPLTPIEQRLAVLEMNDRDIADHIRDIKRRLADVRRIETAQREFPGTLRRMAFALVVLFLAVVFSVYLVAMRQIDERMEDRGNAVTTCAPRGGAFITHP